MGYTTTPNQKVVVVKKERCDKNNCYATINLEALQEAMVDLADKPTALKLWLYFAKNQNEHCFAFSPADCIQNWGFKKTTLYENFAVLEERGYIKCKEGNIYYFIEKPR